jgi:leucine efflux protein
VLHPLQFVLASIAIILLPGPGQVAILTASLSGGRRAAYRAVGGLVTGDVAIMSLVALGTDAVLVRHPEWLSAIRVAGGLYVCWLGGKVFLSPLDSMVVSRDDGSSPRWYLRTVGITLLNPKAVVFFASFFPLFADLSRGVGSTYLRMGLVFTFLSASYLVVFATAGSRLAHGLQGSAFARRWVPRGLGTIIAGFGAWMVLG